MMDRHRNSREDIESIKAEMKKCWKKGLRRRNIIPKLNLTHGQYDLYRREMIEEGGKAGNRFRVTDKVKFLKGKPFWIWDDRHAQIVDGLCCFNHLVGLPKKNGKAMPLFDYEKKIIDEREMRDDCKKDKRLVLLAYSA